MTEGEKYFTYTDIQTGDSPMKRLVIKNRASGISSLQKQLRTLEQENNALKAKLQNITVQSNNEITALKQENEKIRTRQIKLYIALDVIKDIAEKYSDSIDKANDALYSIIDKINEVIK